MNQSEPEKLKSLIEYLRASVSNSSIDVAEKYLSHREWGLCLQALGHDYLQEGLVPDEYTYKSIIELCLAMGFNEIDEGDEWFYRKFKELERQ